MENINTETLNMYQLNEDELQVVTGGNTTGAAMALGGTLILIGAGVAAGGVVGVMVITGAAILGLGYAYDSYSSMNSSMFDAGSSW